MNEHLKYFNAPDAASALYISLSGVTYPDPTYEITRARSEVTVIEYITDGSGHVVIDGETHRVCKDTIYLLRSGEHHHYYSDSEEPFTKIFLNVQGSLCEQIVLAYGLAGRNFFDGGGLKPLFERIFDVIRSDTPEDEMQSELQGIFVEIISRLSTTLSEDRHSDEARKLKNHLDSNIGRLVSTKELAKIIFRSQDYCQKLFKREFGSTPYAYQIDRKMQVAKSLLANTRLSISEIAERLGYTDIHYFSNLFKSKCGCRPSSYRKSTLAP